MVFYGHDERVLKRIRALKEQRLWSGATKEWTNEVQRTLYIMAGYLPIPEYDADWKEDQKCKEDAASKERKKQQMNRNLPKPKKTLCPPHDKEGAATERDGTESDEKQIRKAKLLSRKEVCKREYSWNGSRESGRCGRGRPDQQRRWCGGQIE